MFPPAVWQAFPVCGLQTLQDTSFSNFSFCIFMCIVKKNSSGANGSAVLVFLFTVLYLVIITDVINRYHIDIIWIIMQEFFDRVIGAFLDIFIQSFAF